MMSNAFSISGILKIIFSFDFISWLSMSLYLLNHLCFTCMLHLLPSSLSQNHSFHKRLLHFPALFCIYDENCFRNFPVSLDCWLKYFICHLNVDQNSLYNIIFKILIASKSFINYICWLLPINDSKSDEDDPWN